MEVTAVSTRSANAVSARYFCEKKARIFRDIHQSGHASREDHREMINMLRPKKIIPGHIPKEKAAPMIELCTEMGYKRKDILVLENGKKIEI